MTKKIKLSELKQGQRIVVKGKNIGIFVDYCDNTVLVKNGSELVDVEVTEDEIEVVEKPKAKQKLIDVIQTPTGLKLISTKETHNYIVGKIVNGLKTFVLTKQPKRNVTFLESTFDIVYNNSIIKKLLDRKRLTCALLLSHEYIKSGEISIKCESEHFETIRKYIIMDLKNVLKEIQG